MSDFPVMIKKLKGPGIVRAAAKHNLREIVAEIGAAGHIDPARIQLNVVLRGPANADNVALNAKALLAEAGITRLRSTAVMALELVFTLPSNTNVDVCAYFEDATRWTETYYQVPLLSSVLHLDESAPHCHILILPIVEGHMVGSDLYGDRVKLKDMQANFHEQVRARYGMARQAPAKRHSAAVRAEAMKLARKCLEANSGLADDVLAALLKPHAKDPEPLLLALGLPMPTPATSQSFVAMMTRPTKPEQRNPIGKGIANPIGKAQQRAPKITLPYSCVGKGFTAPTSDNLEQSETSTKKPTSASTSPPSIGASWTTVRADETRAEGDEQEVHADIDHADELPEQNVRERDDKRHASEWDSEGSEWMRLGHSTGSKRAMAMVAVQEELSATKLAQRHLVAHKTDADTCRHRLEIPKGRGRRRPCACATTQDRS